MPIWVKRSRMRWYATVPSGVEGVTAHLHVTAPLAGGTTWLWEARALLGFGEIQERRCGESDTELEARESAERAATEVVAEVERRPRS